MSNENLRVLCVHGVGNHSRDLSWQDEWQEGVKASVRRWDPQRDVEFKFPLYDHIFDKEGLSVLGTAEAVAKLLASGVVHGVADLFRRRGLLDIPDRVRWTAGMVVQWAKNERLRKQTRDLILRAVDSFKPDVICAHSLGSLICYDTFIRKPGRDKIQDRIFVSFGSQIGNPFVRSQFGGRIVGVKAKYWYHLFNLHDDVFTAEINIPSPSFEQIDTEFDLEGLGDHSAVSYLSHPNTVDRVWREAAAAPLTQAMRAGAKAFSRATRRPRRRALLVGINEYPREEDRLEGCVNDVFLLSSVLQETGFDADDIRVVLDDRATASGILSRLEWLLEGAGAGDERVFFYSGHGAQIPGYGVGETVDRLDECLVPYDFTWTRETALTDDAFYELYSQLPYDTRFAAVFDCCHSGGMTRQGRARIRGLNPPDDIRHRMLRWSARHQMWVPRDMKPINKDLSKAGPLYVGASGVTRRLGRSVQLRILPDREYDSVRKELGHHGPYLPLILQACQENEFSYEYRHGVQSYGAFTYSLAKNLRQYRAVRRPVSFQQLLNDTKATLAELKYDQTPVLIGPTKFLRAQIPWMPKG